jgi:hypothetical protein
MCWRSTTSERGLDKKLKEGVKRKGVGNNVKHRHSPRHVFMAAALAVPTYFLSTG